MGWQTGAMDPIATHMNLVLASLPALGGWLILSSVIVYVVMALDRNRARMRAGRVPETSLLWLACLGGWLGALVALWRYPATPFSHHFRGWLRGIVAAELIFLGLAGLPPQTMTTVVEGVMTVALGEVRAERSPKPGRLMLDSSRKQATIENIMTLSAGP